MEWWILSDFGFVVNVSMILHGFGQQDAFGSNGIAGL